MIVRIQVLVVLAVGALLALGVGAATAAETQVYQSSFNGTGSTDGPFSPSGLGEISIDQQTGTIYVADQTKGVVDKFDLLGKPVPFSALGSTTISHAEVNAVSVDNSGGPTQGDLYVAGGFASTVEKYHPDGNSVEGNFPLSLAGPCALSVEPNTGNIWVTNLFGTVEEFTAAGQPTGSSYSGGSVCRVMADVGGIVYTSSFGSVHKGVNSGPEYVTAESPFLGLPQGFDIGPSIAINPVTHDFYIAYQGRIFVYDLSSEPSEPVEVLSGFVNARAIAFDGNGDLYVAELGIAADPATTKVSVFKRQPPSAPLIRHQAVTNVHSDSAELSSEIIAAGSDTSYRLEYGPDANYGNSFPTVDLGPNATPYSPRRTLEGLTPGTTYHYRFVATNAEGTTYGPDRTFSTFSVLGGADSCPNALARKQTGARALPDCRAYELVSAADTGGYDVESYLAPGQNPFPGYPQATDKLLYATHSGAVPGPWNATNKGPDPYLATRTADGWTTSYEGLPANLNPAAGSFSSVLGEADSSLDTLAFAGPGLCDPCFSSGLETGIPVRMPNGELVQGMSGSSAGSVPASAKPEGKLAKYFPADGKDLLFASKYAFEPGANTNGDLTVYERNLTAGTTEIVSTDTSGNPLTGSVSELGVSGDGSRVLTATKVSVDSQGNEYVHPYLHLAGDPDGIDLAPGTTSGVLFAGLTEDGSKAFFTTADKLLPADTDSSPDLYEAEVDSSGNLSLKLVTPNNSDACSPVANANGEHWNTTGSAANCGAVAVGGGGGVAADTGTVYFLSPESFGGQGTLNQPNLYSSTPGGSPVFVSTLDPETQLVLDSVKASATRYTADFEVTPSGAFAAFASLLPPVSGEEGEDEVQILRYDAGSNQVGCASCDPAHTAVSGDASLPPNGSGLADDGRVFFDTPIALVLLDSDNRSDVYEWNGGAAQLISSGISPFDAALLSVSADGTDVYFFTHDTLAPEEDHLGPLTKLYDARAGGGFFKLPPATACAASDECHGPGTAAPGAPNIKSSGQTSNGNVLTCPKNRVKHHGKCVKKHKKHAKKHRKKKGASKKRAAKTKGKRGGRNA